MKLRTLDKPFGFLVLKPSGVRFEEILFTPPDFSVDVLVFALSDN